MSATLLHNVQLELRKYLIIKLDRLKVRLLISFFLPEPTCLAQSRWHQSDDVEKRAFFIGNQRPAQIESSAAVSSNECRIAV